MCPNPNLRNFRQKWDTKTALASLRNDVKTSFIHICPANPVKKKYEKFQNLTAALSLKLSVINSYSAIKTHKICIFTCIIFCFSSKIWSYKIYYWVINCGLLSVKLNITFCVMNITLCYLSPCKFMPCMHNKSNK